MRHGPAAPGRGSSHYRTGRTGQGDARRSPLPSLRPLLPLLRSPGAIDGPDALQRVVGSGWIIRHESPGRLRLQNERLHRRREVCQAIERELMSVLGIDNYKTSRSPARSLSSTTPSSSKCRRWSRSSIRPCPGRDPRKRTRPTCTCQFALRRCRWRPRPSSSCFLSCRSPPPCSPSPRYPRSRPLAMCWLRRAAGSRRPRRDRRCGLLGHTADFSRHGPVLVPGLRPGPGQENPGRLQAAVAQRLWQAAEVRLALPRRHRSAGAMDRLQLGDVIVVNTGEVVPVDGFIKEAWQ